MLVDGGYLLQDVASILGVHRTTVWRWFQHSEMRKYFDRYYEKQMRDVIREAKKQEEARMKEIRVRLDSANPWEAYAAAVAVLDRYDWLVRDLFIG